MSLERARKVADAVLFEGYVLYPYRASSLKNRYRWTFGVAAPRAWSEAANSDPWLLGAEFLVDGAGASLDGALRFLHVQTRSVEAANGGALEAVEALAAGGINATPWDEGVLVEVPIEVRVDEALEERELTFEAPAWREEESFHSATGVVVGRVVRERAPLSVAVRVACERVGAADTALTRVTVSVENRTVFDDVHAERSQAMRASLVSTHLLLRCESGRFVSLLDPPDHAREATCSCRASGLHPVLAGEPGCFDTLLCSPIILYDHPRVAPESRGDFFDASEIDELLVLRTITLTDDESAEARSTDARARELLDRVSAMTSEQMSELHGAVRAREETHLFAPGDKVRLRPGLRRTDAQDCLLVGHVATVRRVMQDVDGRDHLAVTVDDDPAAEINLWQGRFHYFFIDEVEAVEARAP